MRHLIRVLAALAVAGEAAAAPPPALTNAKLTTRSAASGLAAAARTSVAASTEAAWVGWSAPTASEDTSCCWHDGTASGRCRGCRLEGRDGWEGRGGGHESEALEPTGRLSVLLRAENGRVGRVRSYSAECPLDAGGRSVVWLEDVRPAESVAFLETLLGEPKGGIAGGKPLDDALLAAIALHADPSADAALDRFVAPGQPIERRKQAAFWLGQARGRHGLEVLKRLVRDDEDRRLREHAVFGLSQSREPEAPALIVEVAKRDPDGHVRGQALFWLAQTAAKRAPEAIRNAIDDDPEVEVKKKAVFALSQLPRDEGIPLLIGVAKTHKSYEVRKQAMFWLGQSHDPRALAFFEDVLRN